MGYDENVFINCPFDGDYQPLFRALVFAVQDCGFIPRSALELDDGSEVRIGKIVRLIAESRYGIHDLSRTELDSGSQLPRFNMPLELGLFLGAKFYGGTEHGEKAAIIFDRDRYRYQTFCSDLAGHDIRPHSGAEREVIRGVRDAVRSWVPHRMLPGAAEMFERYRRFVHKLPDLASEADIRTDELTFSDLSRLVAYWLRLNRPRAVERDPAAG